MEKETWRAIPGYKDIAISSHGCVVSHPGYQRRKRLVTIDRNGTFQATNNFGVQKKLNLRRTYRQLFGRDLEGKPWPVNGRYLE